MSTPDRAAIEAEIRANHPFFTITRSHLDTDGGRITEDLIISPETDPERYEAMVAERVDWRLERQEQDALDAEEGTRAEQAKARYQTLKAGTATAKQTQEVVAYLLRQRHPDLAP